MANAQMEQDLKILTLWGWLTARYVAYFDMFEFKIKCSLIYGTESVKNKFKFTCNIDNKISC